MNRVLLAATVLAGSLPFAAARAQPVDGLYVGAGVGANFIANEFDKYNYSGSDAGGPFHGSGKTKFDFDTGIAALGSIGYGFDNGLRLEVEGNYRYNDLRHQNSYAQKYGGMVNALFDFDIGLPYLFPYVGAGVGYIERESQNFSAGSVAYQGIVGLAFPIPDFEGLSATLEYRFLDAGGVSQKTTFTAPGFTETVEDKYVNNLNHSLMVGLRYAFDVAPPPPPPAPEAVTAPVAAPARSDQVLFDWDRADLSDRARHHRRGGGEHPARQPHPHRGGRPRRPLRPGAIQPAPVAAPRRHGRGRVGARRGGALGHRHPGVRRHQAAGADRRRGARAAEPARGDRDQVGYSPSRVRAMPMTRIASSHSVNRSN